MDARTLYQSGRSSTEARVVELCSKAAAMNSAEGRQNMSVFYAEGYGDLLRGFARSKQHCEAAASQKPFCLMRYAKAAEQGIAGAEENYGDFLKLGIGGPTDVTQARIFYRRAADQDQPDAFRKLQELERKT
ncbi:unnamed protein product [Didymodactylos carnosus]|uniref:Sel1 repeat family protein n=1 Tax=Didymodactylos carnosus TaxID=1234261 RepID=A0A813X0A4_9BILA|nr:unnamed protein product [Didymodactylos carnosus]CAF3646035.1 unnamed protein product [Didymodactylos carnosus]